MCTRSCKCGRRNREVKGRPGAFTPQKLSTLFFEVRSVIDLELTNKARLAGQSAPGIPLPLLLHLHCHALGQAEVGPYTCKITTLPTEHVHCSFFLL